MSAGDDRGGIVVALLEDDRLLRERILLPRLADYGFAISGWETAASLLAHLEQASPHIVVLDVGLPDADGFALAQSLRRRHPRLGIVMLTGRGETADRVRGLSEGADAYLTKPVEVEVLAATLHSLARRLQPADADRGRGWRLAADGWRLLAPDGTGLPLTQTERRLVARLLDAAGAPVAREQLIAALTDDTIRFDPHRLESIVHRLRRKAATLGVGPLPLRAVHGEGYVFSEPA